MENENTKYLYGASVQGIQGFIFQTNKLKEIVGGSELVEEICTTAFNEFATNGESIVRAAGNIKHIFQNEDDCKNAVRTFPRKVMSMAPGITISQAVVTLKNDESDYAKQSNELEMLLRAQRNKAMRSMTLGLMGISRAPSTGLPAIEEKKTDKKEKELLDSASVQKISRYKATQKLVEKSFGIRLQDKNIAYDIEDITDNNNWIAVIHADGNGMGAVFQEVGKHKEDMKLISPAVNRITEFAAQQAFNAVKDRFSDKSIIPIRPVVLGGDDLTLICRADLAMEYTKVFLEEFEAASKGESLGLKNLKLEKDTSKKAVEKGLTACAGVAFIKSSYPFHYAVHLAESLCGRAKKAAKGLNSEAELLPPSCLMFHKVQDSFVEDFSEIVTRELTPQENLSFEYGPYYCGDRANAFGSKTSNTIESLLGEVQKLQNPNDKEFNAVKSNLRQWIGLLFDDPEAANQRMKRIRKVSPKAKEYIDEKYESVMAVNNVNKIPFYDILSLASLNITTKESKK